MGMVFGRGFEGRKGGGGAGEKQGAPDRNPETHVENACICSCFAPMLPHLGTDGNIESDGLI